MTTTRGEPKIANQLTSIDAMPDDADQLKVIVGIPCYNEEVAIGSIVLRASKYADKVVVIDDGSIDKTAEVARLAGADVIVHHVNIGKGAALRDLFEYATENGADIIVTLDGDGQHDPDDIPKLVQPLLHDEADIVNGSRYLTGEIRDTPLYRRFGQVILDRLTHLGLDEDMKVTDTQSGFRAFSIKAVPHFTFGADRLAIDSEMLLDAADAKLRIKEVGIGVRYDVGHSSRNPLSHGLQVMMGVLRNIEFKRPLIVFTVPGCILITIGVAFGVYAYYVFQIIGNVPYGPAILTLFFTLTGTFMAFTGIILHSVSALINRQE